MSQTVHRIRRLSSIYLVSSFAAALSMGASHQALAACTNNPPTSGQTVDCTGTGNAAVVAPPDSTGIGGATDVTVNIGAGASITGSQNTGGTSPNFQFSAVSVNDGSTVNNNGTVSNASLFQRDNVGVNLNGSDTTLVNNGTISLTNSNSSLAYRLYGVISSVPGTAPDGAEFENVHVINNGTISVSQSGNAVARGVYAGEGIDSMTIDNYGTISVTRTGNPSSTQGTAGIDSDDDTDELVVNNHTGATISASGGNTYAVSGRAQDYTLQNDGTITNVGGKGAIGIYGGGDDAPSETTIDNSKTGIINGNVYVKDTSPLGATLATSTNGTRNSTITNEGTVNGSFFLGAGAHTLENTGSITGSASVNQTTTGGDFGAASFELTNESGATFGGSVAIQDRVDSINSVTLEGTGFNSAGSITSTGFGALSVTLDGVTNIGGISNATSLNLMESNVAVSGAVSLVTNTNNSVSQINTTIFGEGGTTGAPSTNLGSIQGTLTLNGAATNITSTFSSLVRNGDVYQLASTVNGSGLGNITADSTYLVSVDPSVNANRLLLTMTTVSDVSGTPGASKPATQALNGLLGYGGSNENVLALGGAVQSLQTAEDVAKAGAQLAPETNYATQQASITLNNVIGQHIDTRLNAVGATGVSPGYSNGPYGLGMKTSQDDPNRSNLGGSLKDGDGEFVAPRSAALWGQAFGAGMDQNKIDQVDGYNSRIYGFIAGYDNWISPNMRVGVAGGYANTSIDGKGDTSQNQTGIDSYLIEAYGALKGDGWYATGRTGFTWHDYDTTRVMTVPFSDGAKGNHDGDQFNVAIEAGIPIAYAGAIITPVAGLTYSRLHQDEYTEASEGGMGLSIDSQTNDSVVSSLGLKGLVPIANDTVVQGRALWLHEFADASQVVGASFAGGGGSFTAAGPSVGRDTADLGVGMLAQIGPNSTFEINYDANVREEYLAHIGSARVDIHF